MRQLILNPRNASQRLQRRGGAFVPGPRTAGPNLVVNGGFDENLDGWTVGEGWGWESDGAGGGVAACDGLNVANSELAATPSPLTVGEAYTITYTVTDYTAQNVRAVIGGSLGTRRSEAGTFTETLTATTTDVCAIRAGVGFIGKIDNVIVTLASAVRLPT